MSVKTRLEIHPLAATYPPMNAAEMEALTEDIRARGLQRSIVLYEGKVLDGRNRLAACQAAGVEPTFETYEGDDPLGHVNSLNLNRDLTGAQRAIIAARQWMLNGDTKDRGKGRRSGGDDVKTLHHSAESLVTHHRVNRVTMTQARDLLAEAPDLASQVEGCTLSLAKAHEQLQVRRADAKQKSKDAERASKYGDEYREAISNGQMTLDEALDEILRKQREETDRIRREFEARQFFYRDLTGFVEWLEKSIATRKDSYLAWYAEPGPGEPVPDHSLTIKRINEAMTQFDRIRSITFGGKTNGHKA